ncbi:MAG: carboxypeptidase-like regulatory domain-containing protein, partial [Blastocatellia bacterium]
MLREPNASKTLICGRNVVRLVLIGLAVVALLANAPVAAQEISGQIRGVVLDAQGAVVPRAAVTATHVATNTAYRTTTGSEGAFVLPNVRLGYYAVTVEGQGFRRTLVQNVNVEVGGIADLNVTLQA